MANVTTTIKKPWPTKAVMTQIYAKHLWGGAHLDFYSGEGSHHKTFVVPYVTAVTNFLKSQQHALTICDLGCGDFNIGKNLLPFAKNYIAIDIVAPLIERNKALFKEHNLEFRCLDIVKDKLPKADCVILRQVLQHLSNAEINTILNKLSNYTYLILTEHLPMGNFEPNKDKIASQGIRLKQQSGVDILAEPFRFQPITARILNEVLIDEKNGKIVTTLYQLS